MTVFRKICNRGRWLTWTIVINLTACSLAYWAVEGKGPITSAWWAIVSGSTTGYGDQFPVSTAGRGIAAWLIVSMIALVQIAGAQLTRNLIEDPNVWSHDEQEKVKQEVADTKREITEVRELLGQVVDLLLLAREEIDERAQADSYLNGAGAPPTLEEAEFLTGLQDGDIPVAHLANSNDGKDARVNDS